MTIQVPPLLACKGFELLLIFFPLLYLICFEPILGMSLVVKECITFFHIHKFEIE